MKKILMLLFSVILLSGCANNNMDKLKSFKDYNSQNESYKLEGQMTIISNEDKFEYDIAVAVKDINYYRVSLINKINNHEQIILRNKDGVYV